MRYIFKVLTAVFLVVTSVVCTLVLAEVLLRHTDMRGYMPSLKMPSVYIRYNNQEGMPDITPNFPTSTDHMVDWQYPVWSNNIGCFDSTFATGTKPYIYLAGDSFAWGFAPFEDKWGTVFEKHLGLRVAKCGVPGFGTGQELIKATSIINAVGDPDVIVVGYYGNDPRNDIYFAEHHILGEPFDNRDFCKAAVPAQFLWWKCWLDAHSLLYNILKSDLQSTRMPPGISRTAQTFFFLSKALPHILTEDEYRVNEQNILGFRSLAQAHNARLLFVLIPTREEVQNPATATPTLSNTSIKKFLEREDITTLDLLPGLKKFFDERHVPLYWTHDPHLNREGNHLVGELVSDYIRDNVLVP